MANKDGVDVSKKGQGNTGDASAVLYAAFDDRPQVKTTAETADTRTLVKNSDGSTVTLDQCADGKVHPVQITFPDGWSTNYHYSKTGKVDEFATLNQAGNEIQRYQSRDDGQTYTEVRNRRIRLEGSLVVKEDGSALFTDKHQTTTIESSTDGNTIIRSNDKAGNPHKVILGHDGCSVEVKTLGDGQEHPVHVWHSNHLESIYKYNENCQLIAATEWSLGGPEHGAIINDYHAHDLNQSNGIANWIDESPYHYPTGQGRGYVSEKGEGVCKYTNGWIGIHDRLGRFILQDPQGHQIDAATKQPLKS